MTHGDLIAREGSWSAYEMLMGLETMRSLWEKMSNFPSLFSDVTRGDVNNFVAMATAADTYWIAFTNDEDHSLIGAAYINSIDPGVDCRVHLMFFDRKLADKDPICRAVLKWLFGMFHFHRITAQFPSFYKTTLRMAKRLGFIQEGVLRESILINGKWHDEVILGLLSKEMT